jgi:hypothetical protein
MRHTKCSARGSQLTSVQGNPDLKLLKELHEGEQRRCRKLKQVLFYPQNRRPIHIEELCSWVKGTMGENRTFGEVQGFRQQ